MQPDEYNPLPPDAHAFLDGRLAPEAEADFRRRMDDDDTLRANVEKMHGAIDLLKSLPAKDPGPAFNERVMGRVRESELIDRARRRIRGARAPLWQHFAQVAAGAVAAALVLALAGVFGPGSGSDPLPMDIMATAPTEEDLQPALADQHMRLRRIADHVGSLAGADAEAQRQLLRAELEYSGLQRRNLWLGSQISGLPVDRRRDVQNYLDSMARALTVLDQELAESAVGGRPIDVARARAVLEGVRTPQGLEGRYQFSIVRSAGGRAGARVSAPESWAPQVRAYAAVREALYSNDNEIILAACEAYLRPYGQHGQFARAARLHEVACLVRLGRPADAAERFEQTFGLFEEKLAPADVLWLNEWMSAAEREQLRAARKAMRETDNGG